MPKHPPIVYEMLNATAASICYSKHDIHAKPMQPADIDILLDIALDGRAWDRSLPDVCPQAISAMVGIQRDMAITL